MRIPTARQLCKAARSRWNAIEDSNRHRSEDYCEAELAISLRYLSEHLAVRPTNWVGALHRYEQFWRDHGRTARENTRDRVHLPAEERRLGEWARYQRRFEANLTAYQRIRLTISPAFEWDPHDAAWNQQLNACHDHVARCARLPYLNTVDRSEFALARWLNRQLTQIRSGSLPLHRLRALDELLQTATRSRAA